MCLILSPEDKAINPNSNILTSAPRLYLALIDKTQNSNAISERSFQDTLQCLTNICKLPTSKNITNLPRSTSEVKQEKQVDIEVDYKFPSLLDGQCIDHPENSLLDGQHIDHPENSSIPVSSIQVNRHQPPENSLRIEIPARRANSVPEALSIPWVHQSIPEWRNTSMPSWTACTHLHQHHEEGNLNTPSLVPIPSSVETVIDAELISPILPDGVQSSCMHVRELSSDTVITAATSVQSEDMNEGHSLQLGSELMSDLASIGESPPFGVRGVQQLRRISEESNRTIYALPSRPVITHPIERRDAIHANSSAFVSFAMKRPHFQRNEQSFRPDNRPLLIKEMGVSELAFSSGSSKSLIRRVCRRMPEPGIVSHLPRDLFSASKAN